MDNVEHLLAELTNAFGAVGFEDVVRKIMRRELSAFCDSLETDEMGSLLARLRGGRDSPRVMIAGRSVPR